MATSPSLLKRRKRGGFSVLEVVISIGVLTAGMTAAAGVIALTMKATSQSQYTSTAALLASEKLDDLNRYPVNDPAIAVTSGTTAGSLTADTTANVTVGAVNESVSYFDEVRYASGGGAVSETLTSQSGNTTTYTTTTHKPDGTVTTTSQTTAPAGLGSLAYKRRWVIEKDQPIAGVRRITVLVTLENAPVSAPVNFQMSLVHP